MKLNYVGFLFSLLTVYFSSCTNEDTKHLKQEYINFLGSEVCIPYDKLENVCQQSIPFCNNIDNSKYIYVSYHDNSECSPCLLATINKWEEILSLFENANLQLEVVYILNPSENSVPTIIKAYKENGYLRNIYFDKYNSFERINSNLPKNKKLRTFLMDKNHNVVLIGDPTRSEKLKTVLIDFLNTTKIDVTTEWKVR